jgi:hypothetical protein
LRWRHDGSPLMAEHPPRRNGAHKIVDGAWTVEIDEAGDLVFDGLEYSYGGASPCVPGAVLRALVADAIARGVWPQP